MLNLDFKFLPDNLRDRLAQGPSEAEVKAFDWLLLERTQSEEPLGWFNWPLEDHSELILSIKETAKAIRSHSRVLVVIGIGGSYLGAKAIYDGLSPSFKEKNEKTELIFAGQNMSSEYLQSLKTYLKDKTFSLCVISKSGTTLEPALAFRYIYAFLIERFGFEESKNRIVLITDPENGALRKLADEKGYKAFDVPINIGGRYSVHTAVGLLPLAIAGFDIEKILEGAAKSRNDFEQNELKENLHLNYAIIRNCFYREGKKVELFASYQPRLRMLAEWFKQLFAESEGKEDKGLLPVSLLYSTDLHSLGQFVQEGSPIFFETVLTVKNESNKLVIPSSTFDDGLSYLEGQFMDIINEQAILATIKAHVEGNVPNLIIQLDGLNEYSLGYLTHFFMTSCALSGRILGVNPFNQPGVEAYKNNMYRLLKKLK